MVKQLISTLALTVATFLARDAGAGRELLVVVHSSNPAASLDKSAVKTHYLKQAGEWTDGNKVRPVDCEGDARQGFIGKVLQMSSKDYERYWLERKYAAAESPPKQVDDDEAVLKYVGASKGAIGFLDSGSLGDNKKVKVVLRIPY
jgi:ABC-type phosphate transport system substrate-binding protein